MAWQVYILQCADNSLYTGITVDLERRLKEHNEDDQKGARYTRSRRPVIPIYHERCDSRRMASQLEHRLKQMSREQKLRWLLKKGVKLPRLATAGKSLSQ